MKIAVCVKRVPHTAARVRPAAPEGGGSPKAIAPQGVEHTLSPYDEIALAEAVRWRDQAGGGEVVAVSVGTDESQTILRTALAMGADAAFLVRANAPTGLELDGFQVASLLAGFLKGRTFDLLLFGRLAADSQGSQVGVLTSRLLGVPVVAEVTKIERSGNALKLHHQVEGRVEIVEAALPAAATAQKGLAEAPYPSIKQIMAAKKKPIETVQGATPDPVLETLALELPPARKAGCIVGEGPAAVPELVRRLREEAKVL